MTICLVCRLFHQFRAGLESYTYSLACALASRGHNVHIVTEDKGKFYRQNLGANVHLHTLQLKEDPFPGFWRLNRFLPLDDIRFSWHAAKKVKELVKKFSVDIVEVPDVLEQGFCCALTKPAAVVLRMHGWFSSIVSKENSRLNFRKQLALKERILWWMQKVSIKNATGVSAVARDYAGFVRDLWELDGKEISIVPNAVDTKLFTPGHGAREQSVLFVGRMEKNKGIQVLAQAIPDILQEFPKAKFYFAGRDTRLENSSMKASEFILQHVPAANVIFLGELATNDLIPFYQKSAVAVFPSLYEPFGIVALEAMACGCATVATRSGGFVDIIDETADGLLAEPGSHADLARAVKLFLRDEKLREACSKRAVLKVQQKFTLERLADLTLENYAKVIFHFKSRHPEGSQINA